VQVRDLDLTDPSVEEKNTVIWLVTGTIGAEASLGRHFGLSGEVGGGRAIDPTDQGRGGTGPMFGLGLHYYW
jgi:hypothetical protein